MTGRFSLATSLQYGTTSCNDQKLSKASHVGNVDSTESKKLWEDIE